MRIGKQRWLSVLPVLVLTAACSESRTPTAPAAEGARFELVGTTTVASDCQLQIDALIGQTVSAPITSKDPEKDRIGLITKLTNASAALDAGKNADAVQKLNDYVAKVLQLVAAGKLDAVAGGDLITGANNAIDCINAIGA